MNEPYTYSINPGMLLHKQRAPAASSKSLSPKCKITQQLRPIEIQSLLLTLHKKTWSISEHGRNPFQALIFFYNYDHILVLLNL